MNIGKLKLSMVYAFSTAILFANELTLSQIEKFDAELKSAVTESRKTKKIKIDLLRNGNFAKGKDYWHLHECKMGNGSVIFANQSTVYAQLWQILPIKLPAGTKLHLETDAVVNDPTGMLKGKSGLAQIMVGFSDKFNKKRFYAKGEQGRAKRFSETGGKTKTFTEEYTVPEGTENIMACISMNIPVSVEVSTMRLFVYLTAEEVEKLNLTIPAINSGNFPVLPNGKFKKGETTAISYPVTIPMNGSLKVWEKVPLGGSCSNIIPTFVSPEDSSDCSVNFKLAMDNENLYILALVEDDRLNFKEFGDYNTDSLELFFSPLFRRADRNAPTDFHLCIAPESKDLKSFNLTGDGFRNYFRPFIKGVPYPKGWGVEVSIPLKNSLFEIFPYDGYIMGFNIQYNDNDSGKREHKISWAIDSKEVSWARPDVLGAAILKTEKKLPIRLARKTPLSNTVKEDNFVFQNKQNGSINILKNGDFEAGEAGWTDWYGVDGSFMKVLPGIGRNGSYGAVIDATLLEDGAYGSSLNSHCFQVMPGQKFRLRFMAKNESEKPVSFAVTYKSQDYYITYIPIKCSLAPNEDWKEFIGDFVVPKKYDRENSVVQIMIRGRTGGTRVLFDDFTLTSFNPASTDAELSFDATGFAFPKENVQPAVLRLHNNGEKTETFELETSFHDFFRDGSLLRKNKTQRISLKPGEEKNIKIPVFSEKYGLFQIRTLLTNLQDNSKIFRRSEYAVYHKATNSPRYAGACVGHHHLKHSAESLLDGYKAIGLGSLRTFIDRQQEYAYGKYDFRTLDILVDAAMKRNIDLIACIRAQDFNANKAVSDLLKYENYLEALVKHFKGRIPYYELGNEPNLWMGWVPKSSAEEYSMFQRAAFCTIRSIDPDAKIMNAGISQGALDEFTRKLLALNAGNFYDIFAFHPYDLASSPGYRQKLEETILTVNSYNAATPIFDTEASTNSSDGVPTVEKLTKRIPVYLYLGVRRHHNWAFDRMSSGHIYSYFCSPGASYPAYSWLTSFYPDEYKTIGGGDNKGEFECYAGRLPNGEIRAAVWRIEPGSKTVFKMPATPETRVYDVFGNDVTSQHKRKDSFIELLAEPQLPLFVKNCGDISSLGLKAFTLPKGGNKKKEYADDILLLPNIISGFFERNIPGNSKEKLNFYVKNYSSEKKTVRLTAKSVPSGFYAEFEPAEFNLKAGEVKFCNLKVKSPKKGNYVLHCSGSANGETLADVPISFTVTGMFNAQICGTSLKITNSGTEDKVCSYCMTSKRLTITPFSKNNLKVPAGKSIKIPLFPLLQASQIPDNGNFPVEITLNSDDQIYKMNSSFKIIVAQNRDPGAFSKPWFNSWGDTPPLRLSTENFSAALRFRYDNKRLFVGGSVEDPSFEPKGKCGFLTDGDSVVIGIDPNRNITGPGYASSAFEAGFAPSNENYIWNGTFGKEAARPFPEAKAKFFRTENGYEFNIIIPLAKALTPGGRIGLSVMIINHDKNGKLQTLKFAEGMEQPKDASLFGTLLLQK